MQISIIQFLQSFSTPWLDRFFILVTQLGGEMVLAGVIAFVYWSLDKEKGKLAALSTFTSVTLNSGLKGIFMVPRPLGKPGIRAIQTATGYSFPSGHAQGSAAAYFALPNANRKYGYVIAAALCLLVALSRVYLGVHYPLDVGAGLILGLFIALGYTYVYEGVNNFFLLAAAVGLVLALFFLLPPLYSPSPEFYQAYGGYLGFALGSLFEQYCVKFKVHGGVLRRIIRWAVGMLLVYGLKLGLAVILPMVLAPGIVYTFIESGTLTFFLMGFYPLLFKELRL